MLGAFVASVEGGTSLFFVGCEGVQAAVRLSVKATVTKEVHLVIQKIS
jgi:hypothetical protein